MTLLLAPLLPAAGEGGSGDTDTSPQSAGTWTKKSPSAAPSARARHFMAYDPPTQRIVLFGGTSGGGETWVYDTAADSWTQKTPSPSPSSRNAHAMTYDTKRNLVFLFGGTNGGGETWTYDASADTWTNKNPSGAPAARTDAKVVYEPTTDRVLLFGGKTSSGRTNDFYAYDPANNSWMSLPLPTKPSARHRHAMALDPVARKVVLHGGCIEDNCASQFSDETWVLDPLAGGWTQRTPSPNAGARDDHTLIWDAKNSKLLTCCGYVGGSGFNNDVWVYDTNANAWTMDSPSTKPSARYSYDWAWDAARGVAVLFGGQQSGGGTSAETWVYDPGGGGGQAPAVVSTEPAANATSVPVTAHVNITFSIAMDKGATESAIGTAPPIPGSFAWSAGDTKVTLLPTAQLAPGTKYTVTVGTGAKSAQGVALPSPHMFSFTTASASPAPQVAGTGPQDGATGVALDAVVMISFTVPMNRGATEQAVSASPDWPGTPTWTWSAGDTILTIDPANLFQAGTRYTVTVGVGAQSAAGVNLPAPHAFSFTTVGGGGTAPPSVKGTTPSPGATDVPVNTNVSIEFDRAMSKSETEAAVTMSPNPPNQGTWSWSNGDATLTIDPVGNLAADTEYTMTVGTGAKSAAGVALPSAYSFKFRTGTGADSKPPQIVHTPVTSAEEGTPVSIKATVTDDVRLDRVELKYRKAGATQWSGIDMVKGTGDEHTGVIPAAEVVKDTEIEYWIAAHDLAGNTAEEPASAPASYHTIEVKAKGSGGGGGGGGSQGGMLGMGTTMDALILGGLIAAILVAAAVAMMMTRRKRRAQPAPMAPPFQQGYPPPQGWDRQPGGSQGEPGRRG